MDKGMTTLAFLITAKTHLHVGDEGGVDFTIIDKAVQRDPLTNLPCIHSSSLKGALNEYCSKKYTDEKDASLRVSLFGSDKTQNGKQESKKGEAVFFDAQLLFLPRQDDETFYKLATSPKAVHQMEERFLLFMTREEVDQITARIFDGNRRNKGDCLPATDQDFYEWCSDENLPIIARNKLKDDGTSQTLWYEQVVPAETVFYTIIQVPQTKVKPFADWLDKRVIQIGANATIGYGYCLFTLLNPPKQTASHAQ